MDAFAVVYDQMPAIVGLTVGQDGAKGFGIDRFAGPVFRFVQDDGGGDQFRPP